MPDNNITPCQDCGRPLQTAGSGSITQWISACRCHEARTGKLREEQIETCPSCKKRVAKAKPGSVTQWVFGSDTCCCGAHVTGGPADADEQASRPSNNEPPADEPELELDPDNFPKNRYKPLVEIGRGATGIVYLCRDRLLHKKVAVKVLRAITAEQLVAFQLEAKATSQLKHPSVVEILDFGSTVSGAPYMVMEYVRGITLTQYIHTHGPLPWEQTVQVFVAVADALSTAHQKGILHRDLKSSNILIISSNNFGQDVRLIDFGIAHVKHLTQEMTVVHGYTIVGTPAYMSPDQANGLPYDARSEIYALGCVVFEALTGEVPFHGDTALEIITKHAHEPVPALEEIYHGKFPTRLRLIVDKCLEKDPDLRYQTMVELSEALKILSNTTLDTRTFIIKPTGTRARFSFSWIVGTLLMVVFVVFAGFYAFELIKPAVDRKVANQEDIDHAGESYELEELARKQMGLGEYKQALATAKKSVELDRFNQAGLEARGLAYFLNDFPDQARADFTSILAHKGIDHVSEAAEFHLEILNRSTGEQRQDLKKMVFYNPAPWELKRFAPWLKGEFPNYRGPKSNTIIGRRKQAMSIEQGEDIDLEKFDQTFRSLRLYGGFFTKVGVQRLKGSQLRRIYLANVSFDGLAFTTLTPLPHLTDLQLSGQDNTKELLNALSGSPIEAISFTSCLLGEDFSTLGKFKTLKSVEVANCREFDGSAWSHLSHSGLQYVRWIPRGSSDGRTYPLPYLQTVCDLPELKKLSLDADCLDPANAKLFKRLRKLESLDFSGLRSVPTECLMEVGQIKTLKTLQMYGEIVTKNGLLALSGIHLNQLNLTSLHMDAGIALALSKLNFDELQVGFASGDTKLIRYLARTKSLRRIVITRDGTGRLQDNYLKKLREIMPNCKIESPINGEYEHENL